MSATLVHRGGGRLGVGHARNSGSSGSHVQCHVIDLPPPGLKRCLHEQFFRLANPLPADSSQGIRYWSAAKIKKGVSSMASTQVIRELKPLSTFCAEARRAGRTIGLVPTMGALHEGHFSLVCASKAACDHTVVTIFVNPAQFAPHEDLDRYPRTFAVDLAQLEKLGTDVVFAPIPADHDSLWQSCCKCPASRPTSNRRR